MMFAHNGYRKVDRLIVLAQFAGDYHSGLNSPGYRLLCRTQRALRRYGIDDPYAFKLAGENRMLYDALAAKFGRIGLMIWREDYTLTAAAALTLLGFIIAIVQMAGG